MLKSVKKSNLCPIANPKSIAVFGASNSITAMGTDLLASIKALGLEGAIYPVHLKEEQIRHLKACRWVPDLP